MVNTPQEWLIAENNMGITPANFITYQISWRCDNTWSVLIILEI